MIADWEIELANSFKKKRNYILQQLRQNLRSKRANGLCELCGKKPKKGLGGLQAHHILNKWLGGLDTEGNIVMLCPDCHDTQHERVSYKRKRKNGHK